MPRGQHIHPLGGRLMIRAWIATIPVGTVVKMTTIEDYVASQGYSRKSANALVTGLKISGYVKRYQRGTFQVLSHNPGVTP